VVVDLSGVTFLASSGLAVLIRAAHRATEQNRRVRLVAPTRAVTRPLELTGADQLFVLHAAVDDALADPARPDD
jgi:anti-sigma B factor antagonist